MRVEVAGNSQRNTTRCGRGCIREYDKRFRRATRRAEFLNRGLTRKDLPPGLPHWLGDAGQARRFRISAGYSGK